MKESERESGIYLIDANVVKQPNALGRSLISAYVEGYNKMRISGNGGLTKQQYDSVLAHASKLIGLAVIGESMSNITIKCYLDPFRNDVPQLFVRIYSLSSAMLKDSLESLIYSNQDLAKRVKGMDGEVDTIYYLILRQLFTAARDPIIAESLKITRPLNIVSDRTIAQLIEDIGDVCHNSCTKLLSSSQLTTLPKELQGKAQELSDKICSIYDRSFRAYSLSNRKGANVVIDDCRDFERSVEEFEQSLSHSNPSLIDYALVSQLSLVSRHCRSVAEIAFNKAVGIDKENVLLEEDLTAEAKT
jgi:phosphate uptake regulator